MPTFSTRPPLATALKKVLGATALLLLVLLVPLVATQLTAEVAWGFGDFVAAAALLAGSAIAYVIAARRLSSKRGRAGAAGLLGMALLLVWAELAVGIMH